MGETKTANTIARERVEDLALRYGEPAWLKASRLSAWESYLQTPLPTERDEQWRRTKIASLDLSRLTTLDFPTAAHAQPIIPRWLDAAARGIKEFAGLSVQSSQQEGFLRLDPAWREKGVLFTTLAEALEKHEDLVRPFLERSAEPEPDKFMLMNSALFNCGLFLYVPAGLEVTQPFLSGTGFGRAADRTTGGAIFPRIIVAAGAGSKVDLVQLFGSDERGVAGAAEASPSLCCGVVEVHTGPCARVSYLEVQTFDDSVFFIQRNRNEVAQNGVYRSLTVGLGSTQTKEDIVTLLEAQGASSEVLGLVLGSGNESFSYNTIEGHDFPDTTSSINFRVALKDSATSVYKGTIVVEKVAQRTNAYQTNKNLLLGSEARADSIPKLEILADDVKCSHGATVGPVDKEQIFYLMSRGLTRQQAEELVVLGFFREVLEQFSGESAGEWLSNLISRKIYA